MIEKIESALDKVLSIAEKYDYKGYNKYDALDSPVLSLFAFGNKYLRLIYSQAVMRSPVNIRPLFFVPKTHNPKGMALFAMAHLNYYAAKGDKFHLEKAVYLLDWLLDHHSEGFSGICWGYQYPWQDVGFYAPAHFPNRVVTHFVGMALLDGYETTGNRRYLEAVIDSTKFILNDPKILFEDNNMKCLSYVPDERINWIVMDVSALCAALLARVYSFTSETNLKIEAQKLIHFVIDKQTEYGAWYYTHPPGAHHKKHDNYHTGYICDAILDYSIFTGDESYLENYHIGLKYYLNHLFLKNGAPKWMNDKIYPLDIHGAAQGIISFVKAMQIDNAYGEVAWKIAEWAIDNMQQKNKGYFYYQKHRFCKKRFTLMRWCNGWMSRALSVLVRRYYE
jgi:rhamnogalacturonyl hydrolase YesR